MISIQTILVRLTAAAVAALSLAAPAAEQGEPVPQNESYFEIVEEGNFSQEFVLLREEKVLQVEAEASGRDFARVRYLLSEDGQTLLWIEYYDADGRLVYFSEVLDYDAASKSYTEKVYIVDADTDTRTLLRTDTYAAGVLVEQVVHTEVPDETVSPETEETAPQASPKTVTPKDTESDSTPSETKQPAAQTPATAPAAAETTPAPTTAETVPTPTKAPSTAETTPVAATAPAATEPAPTPAKPSKPDIVYDHTTSIYTDDEKTLLRVEYYNDENKLSYYSSVEKYDNDTKSYTENIYRYDWETQTEILERTDVYVNGELQSDNP